MPSLARTSVPVGKLAVSAATIRKLQDKAEHERNIATALLASVVGVAILLMSVGATSMIRSGTATSALNGSLSLLRTHQSDFRLLNNRFATWTELTALGVGLPPNQSVRASNADASHWFMSVMDQQTGIICDSTGELVEDMSGPAAPVCRKLLR